LVSFTPRLLYFRGKNSPVSIGQKAGLSQSRAGGCGEENIFYLTGTRTPTHRSSSPLPVAVPTALLDIFKHSTATKNKLVVQRQAMVLDYRQGQGFSLLHVVQTSSGAHPASYTMGTRTFPPGVTFPERETDPSILSTGEVNNDGAIPLLPHMPSWRGAKLIKHRDTFHFLCYESHTER
jgi:hypothetical protein